ncbi:MAG: hypothetical protein JXA99_04585 [Candidatus Lokiarchaeota archaeon]|nr:hypothetical protein [Candidatus Lokiarchaeota archaeon]
MDFSDLLNGTLCLIFTVISITIGLVVALKYFKIKQKSLLYFGLAFIGIASLWMAKSISVIYTLLTQENFDSILFMLIGNIFLPIAFFFWILVFAELVYKKYKRILSLCFGIYSFIIEFSIIFFIITDLNQIGLFIPPIEVKNSLLFSIYYFSLIFLILITSIVFGKISFKSENPQIRLKGRLIMTGASLFFLGGIFEILSSIHIAIMIIGRLILIMSAISYYTGNLLPQWAKKIFLKTKL